jgi:CDP-diacylglycerol--glycerol-3-phosphate 3-phosphatidyltransferase
MVAAMRQDRQDPSPTSPAGVRTKRIATIPNIICVLRMLGSIVLLALAIGGHRVEFLWLFVALAMSDWVDGKLAVLLNQRSEWGPRLDSWADFALYSALLGGVLLLHGNTLQTEWQWIAPALTSYTLSTLAGFWRYHCWPSYHTRAAKTSWFLMLLGAVCLLADWRLWPLRIALAAVTLTNFEALLITYLSPNCRDDVGSACTIIRERRGQ